MIWAIIIFCFNNEEFTGVQVLKPCKYSIAFIKARIPAAVYAKRKKSSFFQKRKGFCESWNAGLFFCCQVMVPSRQVSEIKNNTAYRGIFCILVYVFMRI